MPEYRKENIMNIGIDIDNTICNTEETLDKYQNIFIKEKNISKEFLLNDNDYKLEFLTKYIEKIYKEATIKEDAKEVINNLSKNNKIYIITARSNAFIDNIEELINNYFKEKNIHIDKIIIHAKDKVDACLDNHIDIMIEDSLYNYNKLIENNINTILFDDKHKNINIKDRVTSWKEIEKIINNLN